MRFRNFAIVLLPALVLPAYVAGQDAQNADIDPLALRVLHAATDSIQNAKTFSFRAVVAKERLGSNDQVLTFFHESRVTISRPDRLRLDAISEFQKVSLYYDKGQAVLFTPEKNLYAEIAAPRTLDQTVDVLQKREISFPLAPLFLSDPYKAMANGLDSAAVIGRVEIGDKTYHHLAFTTNDADWQIWVDAGPPPTPRRAEILYKTLPGQPRVTIDFFDWNLSASAEDSLFTFQKPADAKKIDFIQSEADQ
jgi:hypothetical protein